MNNNTLKRALLILIGILGLSMVAGCSPLPLLNAVISNAGYTRIGGIQYGKLQRQQLDVFMPQGTGPTELKPVMVFFYGGSWEFGDRGDYRFVAEALTAKGFVTVVPDYRVYPEVRFPEFLNDAASAVRWTKDNAQRFGGDPGRLFVIGHSAGAHIAAMLTLDSEYLARVGMTPRDLRGMVGIAGPYDFLPLKKATLKIIFGAESGRWRSQPINYLTGNNPPMLLLVGAEDTIVDPGNSRRLAAKIKATGGTVELIEYPDLGHIDILVKLAAPFRGDGKVLNAISDFVKQVSAQGERAIPSWPPGMPVPPAAKR